MDVGLLYWTRILYPNSDIAICTYYTKYCSFLIKIGGMRLNWCTILKCFYKNLFAITKHKQKCYNVVVRYFCEVVDDSLDFKQNKIERLGTMPTTLIVLLYRVFYNAIMIITDKTSLNIKIKLKIILTAAIDQRMII